ncbi:MAG TPA: TonB-dependent receptor [Gemmatimonadaceae bacterium]|nr:TonB-dependent receptor [Gemmatimonadaceae bacterium]
MTKLVVAWALLAAPAALLAQGRPDSTHVRQDSTRTLEAVTVTAIRGGTGNEAPVSARTLTAAELDRRSFGQDVPLILQGTPSLTSYSEAANYWGYSYLRLRGIDQSRINLTIDGIPLNDPEDQVLYFADFPDLMNSVGSVQIQRGVGTSAPGTASYGGSINFQTVPVANARRTGQVQLQGGSFGSARASAEYTTGLTSGRFAAYARASALQSSGYRRHSGMEGRSGFLSAAYVGERDVLKLTALAGLFADTLAYVGATEAELARDRRFNPLRPDEVDRFGEQIAALTYTRLLGANSTASATVYRISASGNYDVCINACDQPQGDNWDFHLDFAWYGATSVWSLERDRARLSVGVNANTYARDHYAYARPDVAQKLYFNTGEKDDASAFAKLAYDVGAVTLFGDVQGRTARFHYVPDANAAIAASSVSWSFLNPKVGATWTVRPALSAYISYGVNSREPARSDMFAGFDNLDTSNVAFVGPFTTVRPERAHDLEVGAHYGGDDFAVSANAFAMEFRNEILAVGRLSYIGTPLRTNVPRSWRRGVEADATWRPTERLETGVSATVMRGRIARFTDDETGTSYVDVAPLLTPEVVSAQHATMRLTPSLSATLAGRYYSVANLTNTGNAALVLPSYYVADVTLEWTRGAHGVALHVNNVANSRKFAGGHVSAGEARYYVLPPVNVFVTGRVGM